LSLREPSPTEPYTGNHALDKPQINAVWMLTSLKMRDSVEIFFGLILQAKNRQKNKRGVS